MCGVVLCGGGGVNCSFCCVSGWPSEAIESIMRGGCGLGVARWVNARHGVSLGFGDFVSERGLGVLKWGKCFGEWGL